MYKFNEKIDKYLRKFASSVTESERSRYYRINSRVIRVSDHIAPNSSGVYHIILTGDQYVLHYPQTGYIRVLSYEQIKNFIRNLPLLQSPGVKERLAQENETGQTILGVPVRYFTPGQLNVISLTAKKALQQGVQE